MAVEKPQARRPVIRPAVALMALCAAAFAIRLAFVLAVRSYNLENITYEYGEIAANIVAGKGFRVVFLGADGPTSSQAPVYPYFVALFFWLCGARSPLSVFCLQVAQAAIGSVLPGILAVLCWHLIPRRPTIGWIAAVGATVHPLFLYAPTHVQPVTILTVLCTLTVCTATLVRDVWRTDWRVRVLRTLLWGVVGGVAVLTDPIIGLVFAVSAVWLLRELNARLGRSAAMATVMLGVLAFGVVLTPWIVRNYVVHGRFVPVKSTFGYAFWQGNHPRSWGTDKIPRAYAEGLVATYRGGLTGLVERTWQARHETQYIDDLVLSPAEKRFLAGLPEPERCKVLLHRALGYIRQDPVRYLKLCLQRLRYFLLFDDTNPRTHVLAYRVFHILFVGLTLWGLWSGRRMLPHLAPLLLSYAAVCMFHALTIVSIRFRIPVEPFQLVIVALGVDAVFQQFVSAAFHPRSVTTPTPTTGNHTPSWHDTSHGSVPSDAGLRRAA